MTATKLQWRPLLIASILCASSSDVLAESDAAAAVEAPVFSGPSVVPIRQRPSAQDAPIRACSFWAPVCVHAAADVRGESILHVLTAAERFYRAIFALGLPAPWSDQRLGGDPRYDIYLLHEQPESATISDWRLPGETWDRVSAFSILPPPSAPFGCDTDFAVARALARASVLRVDAGAEDSAIAMTESYLADVIADCSIATLPAIDDFQRKPERFLGYRQGDAPVGSMLFPRFLDDTYGTGAPAGVIFSLLTVAGQRTPMISPTFANEPDLFDALHSNAKARGRPMEDMLLDFAIDRAFVGSRSDDGHLLDVTKYGDAGRVRFEWSIPYETLPRRLAPLRPIDATGATYLWLDLRGAPDDLDLTFVADWEAGVLFHWAVVKVDSSGIELGRINIAGIRGATHAERSLVGLRGVAGLVIVGINAGSIDRSRPFDPDDGELARSYTVTIFR